MLSINCSQINCISSCISYCIEISHSLKRSNSLKISHYKIIHLSSCINNSREISCSVNIETNLYLKINYC